MLIINLKHDDFIFFSDSDGRELGTIHRKDGMNLAFDFLPEIKITRQIKSSERNSHDTNKSS